MGRPFFMTPPDTPETTPALIPPAEQTPGGGTPAPVVSVDAAGTTTAKVGTPKPVPPLPPAAIVAEAAPGETPVPTEVPPQTPVEQPAEAKDKPAETAPAVAKPPPPVAPATILSIDIGGTKVKFLATGQTEP